MSNLVQTFTTEKTALKNTIGFVTKQPQNATIGHKLLLQHKNKITLNISLNKPEIRQKMLSSLYF